MLARFSDAPVLSDLRASVAKSVAEYRSTHEAVTRIDGDKTLTDGGRLVRKATVVRAKMAAAIAALETARNKTAAGRSANEAALQKHFDFGSSNLAEISLAAEVRAHAKSLPASERGKFMRSAFDGSDLSTLRAIASAPAFLSGVPAELHAFAREQVLTALAPEHLANSKILAEGEAAATQIAEHLGQATANLVDFDSADAIAKTAAA